jgi:hypothetical protein
VFRFQIRMIQRDISEYFKSPNWSNNSSLSIFPHIFAFARIFISTRFYAYGKQYCPLLDYELKMPCSPIGKCDYKHHIFGFVTKTWHRYLLCVRSPISYRYLTSTKHCNRKEKVFVHCTVFFHYIDVHP